MTTAEKENSIIETLKSKNEESSEFKGIPVTNPDTVDPEEYKLNHSLGEFAVFFGELNFNTKAGEATYTQTQDNLFEIWAIVRKSQINNPADYIDHVINAVRGGKLETNNPKSKMLPIKAEFVYVKERVWFYRIPFEARETDKKTV